MKSFFSKICAITLIFSIISPSVSAASRYKTTRIKSYYEDTYRTQPSYYTHDSRYSYGYPTNTYYNPCSNLSNVSVGVGILSNGVTISVVSSDSILVDCIKNISWTSYFTRFGNSVRVDVSNTSLGVQIIATSYDSSSIAHLQNTGWSSLITGNSWYSYNQNYSYQNYDSGRNYINSTNTYQNNFYTPLYGNSMPIRGNTTYRGGTAVFGNTSQIARSLAYISNGVQMTFTSPDYNTMSYLQRFSFTNIFSYLSGISITQVNVGGGIQVTVTSGSSSTIQEIQNIGYAIVYQ